MITKREIYEKALSVFGIHSQVHMVFEEMAELQKALCKFERGKPDIENIAEEIADVQIMLEQITQFFCIREQVELEKDKKLSRLWLRMKNVQPEHVGYSPEQCGREK